MNLKIFLLFFWAAAIHTHYIGYRYMLSDGCDTEEEQQLWKQLKMMVVGIIYSVLVVRKLNGHW